MTAQFEAAHRLVGDFGPATRTHGHTYRLEVAVRGERLDGSGVLFDIGRLRALVDALAGALNYRDLNELPAFAGANTTAEAVADYCWEALAADLRGAAPLASLVVRVWESPQVYASREDALRAWKQI
ncbi:MAG: 6-pyruvoyl trahydropterin synthase family protein [Chloroflexia bacterium]